MGNILTLVWNKCAICNKPTKKANKYEKKNGTKDSSSSCLVVPAVSPLFERYGELPEEQLLKVESWREGVGTRSEYNVHGQRAMRLSGEFSLFRIQVLNVVLKSDG